MCNAQVSAPAREPVCAWLVFAVLDLYFALCNRLWPLSLVCYAFFAIPLEVRRARLSNSGSFALPLLHSLHGRFLSLSLSLSLSRPRSPQIAFAIHSARFRRVRSQAQNCMHLGLEGTREALYCWQRVLSEEKPETIERDLKSWYVGDGELGSEDVAVMMAIFLHGSPLDDLHPLQRELVDSTVAMTEKALGRRLPPGSNPNLRCLASYVFEGLDRPNRPLAYYLYMQTLEGIISWVYRRMGFELRHTTASPAGVQNFAYWYKPPPTPQPMGRAAGRSSSPPVVILHGVGGLLPYCVFILHMAWRTRGALIVPLFPQCALSSIPAVAFQRARPPLPAELAAAVKEMLRQCHAQKAAFFAHSFGTVWGNGSILRPLAHSPPSHAPLPPRPPLSQARARSRDPTVLLA